jgi:hypothetical protein
VEAPIPADVDEAFSRVLRFEGCRILSPSSGEGKTEQGNSSGSLRKDRTSRMAHQAFSWLLPRKTTPRDLYQATVIAKLP